MSLNIRFLYENSATSNDTMTTGTASDCLIAKLFPTTIPTIKGTVTFAKGYNFAFSIRLNLRRKTNRCLS